MSFGKRIATAVIALVLAIGGLELGAGLGVPGIHGFATEAYAVIGRPLTPVSVAGVGRRTVRRCAVGVYVC
ncbi:MAG: hypothetical protein KDA73_03410 [Rhodobacteraceae bacterium]|nr:hypothetical protein [Paracoccaceae bacterium]